ncbi:hypothetical protein BX600DRAFT_479184 [Xylariales sp. PMI_506]|nr:hypothetical protein BX600DRAFT_479184 [Xylariales sp. PMI_506]
MSSMQPRGITRNRERLACKECRRRKLKCDRALPCSSCTRRGDQATCTYQRFAEAADQRGENRAQNEARLERLEKLIQTLAAEPANAPNVAARSGTSDSAENSDTSPSNDSANSQLNEAIYNGATHWSAMLDDIEELRLALPFDAAPDEEDTGYAGEATSIGILFGAAAPLPINVILRRYLPTREEVDRLVSAYFRASAIAAPFIHATQFRRQYKQFWEDPSSSPVLWTSILFSMCHIASKKLQLDNPSEANEACPFSVAAAYCLTLGEYFRPKKLAVEALLLFGQSHCLTNLELPSEVSAILGLIVRQATSMGYHRDPRRLALSPFDKEMRRRTWSLCLQLDLFVSFHLGLPSGVQFPTWDTEAPRNLADADFDENSQELPPARSDSEMTQILFFIAKHRFMVIFEKILRHTLSNCLDASAAEELDAEVRQSYASLPPRLQPQTMADSVVDPAHIIVTRLCISFLYLKCLCALHRPYILQNREDSIRVAHQAASNLVGDFVDAYHQFAPGGLAYTESWFISSISWHDFLFGVTLLCLILCLPSQNMLIDAVLRRFGVQRQTHGSKLASSTGGTDMAGMIGIMEYQMGTDGDFVDEAQTGFAQDPSWDYLEQLLELEKMT